MLRAAKSGAEASFSHLSEAEQAGEMDQNRSSFAEKFDLRTCVFTDPILVLLARDRVLLRA